MLGVRVGSSFLSFLVTALCVSSLPGCKRDLGECNLDGQTPDGSSIDGPAAFDIAYRLSDGLPMYEGQALVQSSCGAGQFCHSPAATGGNRIGAPAGLNFDVDLACVDETQNPSCAEPIASCEGGQTDTAYCVRLKGLRDNQNQVNNWAGHSMQELRNGTMPPGAAGRDVRDPRKWIRNSNGDLLPSIESGEGQEIVRNWLACQAPVVARTEIPIDEEDQLTPCDPVDDEICVYSGPQGDLPDSTWNDIYWNVMFTRCVDCHGPDNDEVDQNPDNPFEDGRIPGGLSEAGLAALDLTGVSTTDTSNWASESYPAVVGAPAYEQGACANDGTIVIPEDSAGSLMVQKIRAITPEEVCGDPMPPGPRLSEPIIQVIEEWITEGAFDN